MAEEFVSENITPDAGTFDASAMGIGQPGLPTGFTWRDKHYAIVEVLDDWKVSEREFHRTGEAYYRRHFWRVRVDSDQTMTLYVTRKAKRGESQKKRWWLYSVD